jgi:uncharacterized protein YecT (DUF1311 family)
MNILFPWLMLMLLSNSAMAIDEYVEEDSCQENQLELNFCASFRFHHYDKILNDLYAQQMHYLTKENLDFKKEAGIKFENAAALKATQQQWIKFRDADCMYVAGKKEDGGSSWSFDHWNCMADRTRERALQLEKYVACRVNGCPL